MSQATEALRAQLAREGGLSAAQLLGRAHRDSGLEHQELVQGLRDLLDAGELHYDTEEHGGVAVTLLWLQARAA